MVYRLVGGDHRGQIGRVAVVHDLEQLFLRPLGAALGAKVVQDVMEVGDHGTMSVITDPTGATLAMWQPKSPHK